MQCQYQYFNIFDFLELKNIKLSTPLSCKMPHPSAWFRLSARMDTKLVRSSKNEVGVTLVSRGALKRAAATHGISNGNVTHKTPIQAAKWFKIQTFHDTPRLCAGKQCNELILKSFNSPRHPNLLSPSKTRPEYPT